MLYVELPKFTPKTFSEKKMHVLWLRYLTEINENTRKVSEDLLEVPEINKAVELIKESAFSDAQLLGYDAFWDAVRVENTIISDALKKGLAEGREKGLAEGRAEGRAEGEKKALLNTARQMKADGLPAEVIAKYTHLTEEEITTL